MWALTDTPGAGLTRRGDHSPDRPVLGLRPVAFWKRLASLGLAFAGVAVIYFTHGPLGPVMLLSACRPDGAVRAPEELPSGRVAGHGRWDDHSRRGSPGRWRRAQRDHPAIRQPGQHRPGRLYYGSRGVFVEEALSDVLWRYPGYGMDGWGMIFASFGQRQHPSKVWVEVMVPRGSTTAVSALDRLRRGARSSSIRFVPDCAACRTRACLLGGGDRRLEPRCPGRA